MEVEALLRADLRDSDCGNVGICLISEASATAASSSASSSSESSNPFSRAAVWSSSISSCESSSSEMAISSSVGAGSGTLAGLDALAGALVFVEVDFSGFVSFFAFFGGVDVVGAADGQC